ncbi:MAG: general stress protein [Alkalibacterium sp.]|nr:general stress protein [Alkalibacterium sp.]
MDRHILGTFKNEEEAVMQVEKLLNEEGYSPEELMLVMDKSGQYDEKLESIKKVKVNKVEVEEESMWDKVKEGFFFWHIRKRRKPVCSRRVRCPA